MVRWISSLVDADAHCILHGSNCGMIRGVLDHSTCPDTQLCTISQCGLDRILLQIEDMRYRLRTPCTKHGICFHKWNQISYLQFPTLNENLRCSDQAKKFPSLFRSFNRHFCTWQSSTAPLYRWTKSFGTVQALAGHWCMRGIGLVPLWDPEKHRLERLFVWEWNYELTPSQQL